MKNGFEGDWFIGKGFSLSGGFYISILYGQYKNQLRDEIYPIQGTPFNVQSGWMPKPGHSALIKFIKGILDLPEVPISGWAPCVQDMWVLLEDNEVLGYLVDQACKENWNVIASHTAKDTDISIPRIPSRYWLLNGFNALLNSAPVFIDDALPAAERLLLA